METEQKKKEKDYTEDVKEAKREISAAERCRAVLSIWSESKSPSQVSREYGVQWTVLNSWEKRAMNGMLRALEPRRKKLIQSNHLPHRLETLLEKNTLKNTRKKRQNNATE